MAIISNRIFFWPKLYVESIFLNFVFTADLHFGQSLMQRQKDHEMFEFMAILGLAIMANITKMVKLATIAWQHVFKIMAMFDVFSKNGQNAY